MTRAIDTSSESSKQPECAVQSSTASAGETISLHARAKAIFLVVFEVPIEAQAAAVHARCGDDATLCNEVMALLRAAQAEGNLLDQESAVGVARRLGMGTAAMEASAALASGLPVGTVLGKYTIEHMIGEGGMGIVYRAKQESPERAVALKVIRPGMLTEGAARRFRHEASLLARLQHPGIAAVFDAGREPPGPGGMPYLAMELIDGATLQEYVRQRQPDRSQRLGLFLQICEAVAHAHQRGIIHQDLKPANILVGASARVRVMDFGIARLVEVEPLATLNTSGTASVAGTLAYMSPEQAAGDTTRIDTRTDVYALGVVLYELLSGTRPLQLEGLGLHESLQRVQAAEPTRLTAVDRSLAGDLDVICHRAMSKDPARRYPSVEALAVDVQRHINREPILARADSPWYVARCFVRKYRASVAVAACGLAGIIGFAVYAKVQEKRQAEATAAAEAATVKAVQQEARAEQAAGDLSRALREAQIERGRLMAQNGNLTGAEEQLWKHHLDSPDSVDTRWALRELYTRFRSSRAFGGHDVVVSTLALHPNGWLMAAPTTENGITLTDVRDGRTLQVLPFEARRAMEVEYLPGGNALVAMCSDGTVLRWNAGEDGQFKETWKVKPLTLGGALCSVPSRKIVLVGGAGGQFLVLNAITGETVATVPLASSRARVHALVVDHERGMVAVGSESGSSFVADLDGLIRDPGTGRIPIGSRRTMHIGVAFVPRIQEVWTGETDGNIRRWDLASGNMLGEVGLDAGTVRGFQFDDSGSQVLVTSAWRTDLLDAVTLKRVPGFDGSFTRGFASVLVPHLNAYLAGSADGAVRLWRMPAKNSASDRIESQLSMEDVDARPQRPRLAIGGGGLVARTRADLSTEIRRGEEVWLDLAVEQAQVVALSGDGMATAVVGRDRVCRVYRWGSTAPIREITATGTLDTLAVSNETLILATARGIYEFHDLLGSQATPPVVSKALATECLDLTISPDGNWAVSTQRQFRVYLWNARTGERIRDLRPERVVWRVAFSPDSQRIATGSFAGDIEVFETASLTRLWSAEGHALSVTGLDFTHDGREVISASMDGSVKVWDSVTGRGLATFSDPSDIGGRAITSASFDQSRDVLHIVRSDGTLEPIDLRATDVQITAHREHMTTRLARAAAQPASPPTSTPSAKPRDGKPESKPDIRPQNRPESEPEARSINNSAR